ncbi:uncharacterized protein LOC116026087 isoform X2 [Ipomoea triloba]|uniref:uncharacterized protein LOC116026087 isoform X2 n=1 Tax=Ipomoea triloba TaxID=35885 RepID=UPI00125E9230|nr:uncharacterized protein LOC116026087 isoform X2 [Ipomoea triloba]
MKKLSVYDYVESCYKIETYLKTYGGCIHPMAGSHDWPVSNRQPPPLPLYTAKIGRPKKLRKKSADESKRSETHLTRKLVTLHCSKCKQKGHNIRRCPQLAHNARAVQVVAEQVVAEQVMADLNVVAEQVMAEQVEGNAQGGQREAAAEEIPVNTQPFEELTDDELLRLFDCPILGIPNIGFHYVRVDPLLNVGDNIIANSLTNAQNMAINTSQMEITPSSILCYLFRIFKCHLCLGIVCLAHLQLLGNLLCISQLQFEEMDNTSQQQEQK